MTASFAKLERLFDPSLPFITKEGAQMIADIRAEPEEEERMDMLAEKINTGTATHQESREYEEWARQGALLSVFQAKARRFLKSL
ncbi:MAG: hypothetical protein IPK22_05215 [Verrucomicrobiaceae bacterium]|nr:hypothetical protein [Verrucomicrobiaceae bacterium]